MAKSATLEQLVEPVRLEREPKKPVNERLIEDGDEIDVIPYNAYHDPQSAHFLPWLFDLMRRDGLLKLYYPDIADDEKMFATFVKMFSSTSTYVILVVVRDATPERAVKDVIGFATWEAMQLGPSLVGHCGFIYRKDFWQRSTSIKAGQRIMRYWFEEAEPKLDVLVGLIARLNRLATGYVRGLGWQESGWIHNGQQYDGKTCDAILFQYTREQYEKEK